MLQCLRARVGRVVSFKHIRDRNPDFTDDEDGLSLTFTAFYGTIDNAGQPVLGAELPTNGDENILAFDPTTRRFSITTTNNHRADYNVVIRVTDSGLPLGKTNNAQAQPLNTYEYFRISVVEPPYESTARIDRLVETLNLPSATQNLPYTYTHVGELFDYVPDQFDDPSLTTDGLTIDCSGFLSCTRRRVNNQIEYHFEGTPQNQHVAQTSYTVTARAPWMETLSAQVQLNSRPSTSTMILTPRRLPHSIAPSKMLILGNLIYGVRVNVILISPILT